MREAVSGGLDEAIGQLAGNVAAHHDAGVEGADFAVALSAVQDFAVVVAVEIVDAVGIAALDSRLEFVRGIDEVALTGGFV